MTPSTDQTLELCVREVGGTYRAATAQDIITAAREAVDSVYQRGQTMNDHRVASEILQMKLAGYKHEVFAVLLLDSQHRLISYVELFRGTIDQTHVYPRELVKEVLQHNAAAVILGHCHPSGDPTPSNSDQRMTERVRDALALIEVRVLDHIVIGGSSYCSMAQKGLI